MSVLQKDVSGFELLSTLLKEWTGIYLAPNEKNKSLLASRLIQILRSKGLSQYKEYYSLLLQNRGDDRREFVNAMTTNTTQFFREADHFEILKDTFFAMYEKKRQKAQNELRIWCAASSTGQEVYTILMVLMHSIGDQIRNWQLKYLATDIDEGVLAEALSGKYAEGLMSGIPPEYRTHFFKKLMTENGVLYQVKTEYRKLVTFAQFNLMTKKYPFRHGFDVIFCRNVLIYFDRQTSQSVVDKLALSLNPGGLLFLGHSESGVMNSPLLERVTHSVYRRMS